jgi:hypothetical protein
VGAAYAIRLLLLPVSSGGAGLAESPVLSVPDAMPPFAQCSIPTHAAPTMFAVVPAMYVSMVLLLGTLYGGVARGLSPFRVLMITINLLLDAGSTYAVATLPSSPLVLCHDSTRGSFLGSVATMVVLYMGLVNMYHVVMHLPWPHRVLHSYHHELHDPVPILGMYLHPVEQMGIIATRVVTAVAVGASAEAYFAFMLGEKAMLAIVHERATALGAWHCRHHVAHDEVTVVAAKVNRYMRKLTNLSPW